MKRIIFVGLAAMTLAGCSEEPTSTAEPAPAPVTQKQPQEVAATPEPPPAPAELSKVEPLFDLHSIANKSEAEVTALLGKPTEAEAGTWTLLPSQEETPFKRHIYAHKAGNVEVMFIEGAAVRISFYPKERTFKFPDDAIKAMRAVGLTVVDGSQPESEAPHFLDYGGIDGIYAARVVKDIEGNPENIGFVKIVTEEKYK